MERYGEAFEEGIQLTVVGRKLQPGERAPEFELDAMPPAGGMPVSIALGDSHGSVRLLNVINSVDTPVCHIETRKWHELGATLGSDATLFTISMDLPFAQARWAAAENVEHVLLSSHRNERFGVDYGVLLREWRLLQRAVFVIDREGRIVHAEYVADQMQEPDYDTAVAAVRKALLDV
jgi:thioredoxin-dependent peroxiredoxin